MPATCKKCSLLRALRHAVDYFGRLIELALAPYLGGLWLVTARPPRKGTESVTELLCWVEVLGHSTTATRTSGDVSPACTRKIIGANTGFLTARQTRSPLISPHHYYTKRRPKSSERLGRGGTGSISARRRVEAVDESNRTECRDLSKWALTVNDSASKAYIAVTEVAGMSKWGTP